MSFLLFLALALVFVVFVFKHIISWRNVTPLPPGPRGLPLVGNLFDLGTEQAHLKYYDWSHRFGGDIISLSVMGKAIVVLNSWDAVSEIFEKKGANFSDRPNMPMIVDLMGWDWTFALMRYSSRWKEHRRVFHGHFNRNTEQHRKIQLSIARTMIHSLLKSPERYSDHIRQYTTHIIMKTVYGHEVLNSNDPYVSLVKKASDSTSAAAVPGAYMVDFFPILSYIPEWMPFAGFKRKARKWRMLSHAMVNVPYDMGEGKAEQCFVSECLEERATDTVEVLSEELIKNTAAVAYAAGADTTTATLTTFILAMVLHPGAQSIAQAELDTVIGVNRLPTFLNRDQLPYTHALLKEVLRWIPTLPLAVPHRSIKEYIYKGYRIPAGASIIGNTWAILHNPKIFKEPESFNPERFLQEAALPDPADIGVFGYGRRICAGRAMALDTIWIAIISILYTFNIAKATRGDGTVITPDKATIPGTISHPAPFECIITPRSAKIVTLIQKSMKE